jgi:O-antigen/teichoic acid export membrane protein
LVKRFFKDSAIYGFGKFLVYGVGFFLIPIYTHAFSPAAFGVIDLLNTVARLALLTVALEIAQSVIRFLPDTEAQTERVAYSSTALWFSAAVYGLFVVVGWVGADFFSTLVLGESGQADVFRVALLMIWASGIFILLQNQLRWQAKSTLYTLVSVVDTVISLGLTILFILVLQTGIIGVFWGQTIGLVAGGILALYFTRQDFALTFDWAKLREMLRFSLPLVPSGVAVFVYLYIDRIIINALMTIGDVGIFGVGYRIASIVSLLMFGFQIAMMPLVYQHYREPSTPRNLSRIFRYFVAGALLMTLGLSLFARELLTLLTTPAYYGAWVVVPLLVPATVLSGMAIFAPGLSIAKRTGVVALINIGGAILNTVLNLALIPILGIQGAALATLLSTGAVFGVFLYFSQKIYPVPHTWRQLALAVILTILLVVVGLQIDLAPLPGIAVKVMICLLAAALYFAIGLVEMGDVRLAWAAVAQKS